MTLPRSRPAWGAFPGMAMLALSVAVSSVHAQSTPGIPEALRDKALTVTVHTQVPESPTAPAWEAREVKSTLPGSAVSVKLVGESLAVLIHVTPYQGPEGLMLVTQAQVWIKDKDSVHYHTTLNTLKVAFGEPVAFYPLGEGKGKAPLRVVIVVQPYQMPAPPAAQASEAPKTP
ncbi:MAG TPA: hypothetical protein P5117_09890 [Spirochaetia bacterium]|nr:hypothetical protein [Spirochaetales bacterium]HRY80035.1 hypothetical protein [Spirochaetia bacterium]HRZ89778.1 hypothetical protein [Spirochaetia bacterium]